MSWDGFVLALSIAATAYFGREAVRLISSSEFTHGRRRLREQRLRRKAARR